jgi:hypothetical protein
MLVSLDSTIGLSSVDTAVSASGVPFGSGVTSSGIKLSPFLEFVSNLREN